MLESTPDLDRFRVSPVGRCHVGPTYVLWCAAPDLAGAIQWGAIDEATARDTDAVLEHVGTGGRSAVLDWQCVDRVDGDVLLAIAARAKRRGVQLGSRQVVVLPAGIPHILLAGAVLSLAVGRLRFAPTRDAAVPGLDHPLAPAAFAAAVARAAETRHGSALLVRLRAALRRDLARITLGDAAEQLGLSSRSLQRLLEAHRTTFTAELRRARVLAASELIETTDVQLATIASRLGFGTSSRLTATLRRELDVTAGELRARARRPLHARDVMVQNS